MGDLQVLYSRAQRFSDRRRAINVCIREKNGKLFSANTCRKIICAPTYLEALGNLPKAVIAFQMTVVIVVLFEKIKVENDHCKRTMRTACTCLLGLKTLIECSAIWNPSQAVCRSQACELFVRLAKKMVELPNRRLPRMRFGAAPRT